MLRRDQGIANWTIATSPWKRDTEQYVGLIQGQCQDGSLLAPITYGSNRSSAKCNGQRLYRAFQYKTPATQTIHYFKDIGRFGKAVLNLSIILIIGTHSMLASTPEPYQLKAPS